MPWVPNLLRINTVVVCACVRERGSEFGVHLLFACEDWRVALGTGTG